MFSHLPEIFTAGLLQLAVLFGWLAWRVSPSRHKPLAPYRQPRKALVLLEPRSQEGGLPAQIAAHVSAARDVGLEVICVESVAGRGSSDCRVGDAHALDFSGQDAALPLFGVAGRDAFFNEEFESFLLALKVDEIYFAGGGTGIDVHETARSAMQRGYKVSVLLNAIEMPGVLPGPAMKQALFYAAG